MGYDDSYERLVARYYDAVNAVVRDSSGDAAFYLATARESGGPVLELGCGTGRVLLPIASAGIECVGLDASSAMLAAFRAKGPPANLTLVQGDVGDFSLDARFPLITAPFRVFAHMLDVESQLACLACVRRHLAPGGTFAFDVSDPKQDGPTQTFSPETLGPTFTVAGAKVRRWQSFRRDVTRQVVTISVRFEGGPPELSGTAEIRMRWFYRYELEHLLARAGFSRVTFFGGFDRRAWTAGGETVVLARL